MTMWRIDTRQQTLIIEPVPQSWKRLGGRGLIARVLLDRVPPTCAPLGRQNTLIFAPGLLTGHRLSSCDRISIGGKSPLTGGVKEANAGGRTGLELARLGIKALLIENQPIEDKWWVLHLSEKGVFFEEANDLVGLGVYATAPRLLERYGEHVAIALIGPGGEMGLHAAGIQNLDKDRTPSRIAARGGLGALMGSKRLKAIVIDGSGGQKPALAHPQKFKAAQKRLNQAILDHPQTQVYAEYGTAAIMQLSNTLGALPTRNFSNGQFEAADQIDGDSLRQTIQARGGEGETTHACMAGCIIRCSNVFADEEGQVTVSPLEYETLGLMGSNLGMTDLDGIAKLNEKVNDLGLDSIEIGAALGVAAEAGLMAFGNAEQALSLVEEIAQGTILGRLLGSGAAITGKVLGVERIPTVKGQAMPAYDPRAIKGTGITYATSPQGADHTAGLTIRAQVDHLNPEGQAALSQSAQVKMAGLDTLGACLFAGFGLTAEPELIADLLSARYGWTVGTDILQELGRETIMLEREFNRRAGFTSASDRLPEWMTSQPLPPLNAVFDVPNDDLDRVFEWD